MDALVIHNRHQRRFAAPPAAVAALLDQLGRPDDALWPKNRWPAIRLGRPVTVGGTSGHGPIAYTVDAFTPGESLWFRFSPASGLDGRHGITIEPQPDGTVLLAHEIDATASGSTRWRWTFMIRAMHDQLVEELLDNADRLLPNAVVAPTESERRATNGRSRLGRVLRPCLVGADRLGSIPKPVAVATAATGLVGAAALHVAWIFDRTWPGVDRVDLARKVVGTDTFPGDAETWVVVGLLSIATGLVLIGQRASQQTKPDHVITLGVASVAGVLGLRAVGGFMSSAARMLFGSRSLFPPRDLLIYSPLCAVLAIATASVAAQRAKPATGSQLPK
jgi:hypothetical protein